MDGFSEGAEMVVGAIGCILTMAVCSLVILAAALGFLAGMHFGS